MRRARALWAWAVLAAAMCVPAARAHVGSKDVFEQVQAGPYRLFVTIRTPLVIPGVATVEARSSGATVDGIEIAPVPLTGEASKHAPTADAMKAAAADPAFFSGSLWLMASGSWEVRMTLHGAAGTAISGVPVPAMPLSVLPMQRPLGVLLAVLGLVLVLGMVGIVAAAVREARLAPGVAASPIGKRRAMIASAVTLALLTAAVFLGNKWWNVEAASYAADIYHPSDLHLSLNGDVLTLAIGNYDEAKRVWTADSPKELLADHGHLMHLYAIREPGMDAAFHLHPEPVAGADELRMSLPAMSPGRYRVYGDVVHHNGFPETLTAELTIPPGLAATPLAAEDASAAPPALGSGELGTSYQLPDRYRMVWDKPGTIQANTGYSFRFRLLDPAGRPAPDMVPYLGMAGHAAWVKADGTTFAHTHPEGSAAMPAMMLAEQANGVGMAGSDAAMPGMEGMAADPGVISPAVEFPYGFPSPGRYRVFVQMKHGMTVETGVFDTIVQ